MSNRPTPIVDNLFPGSRVHLIGGASGAGKTTWLMQFLEKWRKGELIHGHKSRPVPFIYISYDRDTDDFIDTCERMKIDPATYQFISPIGSEFDTDLLTYLKHLRTKHEDAKLFIIEGLAVKTPQGKINSQDIVGSWLRKIQAFAKANSITIIGTVHAAKTKEGNAYADPRAKIAGCGAWGGYVSTVAILEEQSAETENARRTLYLLPRNWRKQIITLDFKDGLLTEIVKSKPVKERLLEWLATAPEQFTAAEACNAVNAATQSIYTELSILEKNVGLIRKISHGIYARTSPKISN